MKGFIIMLTLCAIGLSAGATDYLTIYNQNQALYRTDIELQLQRGVQFFSFENIPTQIITESVTFIPKSSGLALYSQNFEYDLANSQKTIQKYINKNVRVTTEQDTYAGTLIFFDGQNYGLLNPTTKELNMVAANKVTNVLLTEMPTDFYTKPTLRWQLNANSAGKFQADLSYLTRGIDWRATYNVILDKNNFSLNSWVTINNRSGKDYQNVTLKLIAGQVQTYAELDGYAKGRMLRPMYAMDMVNEYESAPEFAEREFADYRIYTLDQPADIDNDQEKQLTLYPMKTVPYTTKYEYVVGDQNVDVKVEFKNTTGGPLPTGNVNFYRIDDKDKTQQFVGVNRMSNTSINQDVSLKTGSAFDIVAKTTTTNASSSGRTRTTDYEVSLTNNKSETVEVEIIKRNYATNVEILNGSISPTKKDAYTYTFKMRLTQGQTGKLTFTERITN